MTNYTTSAQPVGYYVSGDELIDQLQERYGGHFEEMPRHLKLVFRAALCNYMTIDLYAEHGTDYAAAMQCAIESAGGESIWDEQKELADFIWACQQLSDDQIEGLIEALTAQIRYTKQV